MAYQMPNCHETISKTYRNVTLNIRLPIFSPTDSSDADKMLIYLEPRLDLKVQEGEEGNFEVFKSGLKVAKTKIGSSDISKLLQGSYSEKLSGKIFDKLDRKVRKKTGGWMGLLPHLKHLIEEGLEKYRAEVEGKSIPILRNEEDISPDAWI